VDGDTLKTLYVSIKVDIFLNGKRTSLQEDEKIHELGYVCQMD
jgi:hypothetical protein